MLLITFLSSLREIIFIFNFLQKSLSICTVPVDAVQINFRLLNFDKFSFPKYIFDLFGLVKITKLSECNLSSSISQFGK